MQITVKPVIIVGTYAPHVFPQPDGQLEVTIDTEASKATAEDRHQQLVANLKSDTNFLPPALIRDRTDILKLKEALGEADVLLVYLSAGVEQHGALEKPIWELSAGIPIIGFSGQYTPMMGMYNLPAEEREYYPDVTYALDYEDIDDRLRLLSVKKRLKDTRIILLGRHDRETYYWEQMPDTVMARRKLGVDFIPVSGAEFVAEINAVESASVNAIAQQWTNSAQAIAEPSPDEIREVAKTYLAMKKLLTQTSSQAISVGCLELMYACNIPAMCFSLAVLRDEGFPAGCEADASATLTMVILEYLSNRPAYMGNLVRADPENKLLMISHGCSPAMVAGRDRPPKPYTLVHSHSVPPYTRTLEGGGGLTSYIDYMDGKGQEVTVVRIGANIDRIVAIRGEIVDCRDTICDRTTITVNVDNPKAFVRQATGNHQVLVWGNYIEDLRALCGILDIALIEP